MEISAQISGNGFSMKDLLAKSGFDLPKIGQVMTGEILSASKNAIMVDLGSLGTGIIYPGEFYDNPNMQKTLKPGQTVSTILIDLENEDGYRELSLKRAQMTTAWEDIKNKRDSGEIITTKVININKGGLIVEINGVQGFLPLSQLAPEHYPKVEGGDTTKIVQALQKMRNQDIQIKILDFSEDENRLIVSEKVINDSLLQEELAKFKVGDIVDAEITDVTDFGAFVALTQSPIANRQSPIREDELKQPGLLSPPETPSENNQPATSPLRQSSSEASNQQPATRIEGLIHISEIEWKLVENPRDFLQTGQRIQAKIIGIDNNKVSLSLKALKPNPWEKVEEKYQVGQTIEGEIVRIGNHGMLIRLDDDFNGFLPMSEFGDQKIINYFKVSDKIKVAIVSIDTREYKIILTLQNEKRE